jgi:hypothetical protein
MASKEVRQQPVGRNHFQFRLHQLLGGGGELAAYEAGGGGGVSMHFSFLPKCRSRADYRAWPGFALCSCERIATVARMTSKLILAFLSVLFFASAPARAAEDTILLNTLGYTTGQSVLLTHMAVGTLADAFVGKAYKAEQATTFVTTYINVTKGMKGQMTKLVDADTLAKNDAEFVQNTIDVLDLVLKEANDLKDFIASGKQTDAQAYDSSRKKALKEIKTLLSIKD